jgi:hypothetical protein
MTNFARSSLALVLRAFFGGAKSCALVNIFMICPPMVSWWLADHDQILPLDHGHLMAIKPSNHPARDPSQPQGTQPWKQGSQLRKRTLQLPDVRRSSG